MTSSLEPGSPGAGWYLGTAAAVLRRPGLWLPALRQMRRLAPRGWWRRPPFLPVPDASYLRFRLQTMYGDGVSPRSGDVVTYLEWCRRFGPTPHPEQPARRVRGARSSRRRRVDAD